jgi:type III secretion YscU/HrpY family protein
MADNKDSGEKTELPTPKKLRDARKNGDIAKSQEITTTVGTLGALLVFVIAGTFVARTITEFGNRVATTAAESDFSYALSDIGGEAIRLLITLSAVVLIPLAAIGLLSEVFQTRGLIATKRLEPKLDKLNPIEGLKRLFGIQGWVELCKTLAKVIAIIAIVWMIARDHIDRMGAMLVPATAPVWYDGAGAQVAMNDANLTFSLTLQVFAWVGAVFVGVAILDAVYARHKFIKKMRMSRRDIKQEMKQDEGDPHMKGHRRELAQEWAQTGAVGATAGASALLVNPTHLAIALGYDPEETPVPVILARGEGDVAAAMRDAALANGVPIIRHIPTARSLWAHGQIGEIVPEDLFDAIAEVILWARRARDGKAPMDCDLHRQAWQADASGGDHVAELQS